MSAPNKSARPVLPGAGKPYECPFCGRRLVDKRSLRQHMAAAHAPSSADLYAVGIDGEEVRR